MTKRQGDLLFIRVAPSARARPNPDGRVLARGEATGHSHAVAERDLDNCDVFLDAVGRLVVSVKAKRCVSVEHQEHGPVELEAGTWEVRRQREYTSSGWLRIAD